MTPVLLRLEFISQAAAVKLPCRSPAADLNISQRPPTSAPNISKGSGYCFDPLVALGYSYALSVRK
jgi:hypothetical protein